MAQQPLADQSDPVTLVVLCEKEELFRQTKVGALCDGHLLVLILYELLYAREGMVQESPLLVVVGLWVVSTSQEVLCLTTMVIFFIIQKLNCLQEVLH